MLRHITIDNFRGIRRFECALAPVTALLGPNSSGKTTVLHAIRVACELFGFALASDSRCSLVTEDQATWISVAEGLLLPDVRTVTPLTDWQALFPDQRVGEGVEACIELLFDEDEPVQALRVRIQCARNQQIKINLRARCAAALAKVDGLPKKSSVINRELTAHFARHAPKAVLVPPFYGTVPAEEYRARAVIDRLLGTGDQSHVVRNLVSGLTTEDLRLLNTFLRDTIGASVTYRTSGDALQTESPLRVNFTDTNGDIELSAAGAGLVNLISLYSALARWRQSARQYSVIFLLDEPEAHLAPRLQAESATRLGSLVAEEFGGQLLMATHSVDILNRLSADGSLLVRCDRSATPSAVALSRDDRLFADLSTWVDLTPYTAINFLASRRIVFCEGDTDKRILPLLGALRFRRQPEAVRLLGRWAVVKLDGTGNVRLPAILRRLLAHETVRAGTAQNPFEIEVLLDADYTRAPGRTEATDDLPATQVWSRHSIESLFLEAGLLEPWIRACLPDGQDPGDLTTALQDALAAADRDEALLCEATDQRTAFELQRAVRERGGALLNQDGNRAIRELTERVRREVQADPARWQAGKARARFILGRVRETLSPAHRRDFPTDIGRLIERADRSRIGDPLRAIPREINAVLERLAT